MWILPDSQLPFDILDPEMREQVRAYAGEIVLVFAVLLGACVGSFINALVYRWPRNLSVFNPRRSFCPNCKHPIRWYDNLPVLSWFILRGRCRDCRAKFSFRYPAVEAACAALFGLTVWWHFQYALTLVPTEAADLVVLAARLFLVADLLAIALIDADHFVIPLALTIPLMVLGPVLALGVPERAPEVLLPTVILVGNAALGAVAGLALSHVLLLLGFLPRSYNLSPELEKQLDRRDEELRRLAREQGLADDVVTEEQYRQLLTKLPPELAGVTEPDFNHRREMLWEVLYLAAPVLGAVLFAYLLPPFSFLQDNLRGRGLLGSILGFLIGGGLLWYVRILFTVALNKQALGLGDVHLMAAVGAMLGWFPAAMGFFAGPVMAIPFLIVFSLFRFGREVPFGPWLCLGSYWAMLLADTFWYRTPGLGRAFEGLSQFFAERFAIGPVGLTLFFLAAFAVVAAILGFSTAILRPVKR